jgi:hypothetical protein
MVTKIAWAKFEAAKRRLYYSLLGFGLSVKSKAEDPEVASASNSLPICRTGRFLPVTNLASSQSMWRKQTMPNVNDVGSNCTNPIAPF